MLFKSFKRFIIQILYKNILKSNLSTMIQQSIIPSKSPNDKRLYQALILENKLKILFIHDNDIAKSACSISVGVGSLFDKQRSLGLAHFLQHMLFMGSKKYPQHNEYSAFISTNSGIDNAFTSDVETNYYFEIKNSAFYEAAQRLTNFFNGALLNSDCIQKQSRAVHQEFVLWTNDDNCRKWEILRKLASEPYSRFNIGNIDTLRHQNIRQDLVQFYDRYYSSNIINAVVCSNESIDDMKKTLIPFFDAIPNKNVSQYQFDLHFTKKQTGKLILMQSIKDQTIMEFFFVIQYLKPLYKKHIEDYITHIIGHEGQNSLLAILKDRKYASQLTAYSHDIKTQTIIGVEIKLTEEGEENYEEIYNIVMDFLSYLKAEKETFQQIKSKKEIQFEFKQKQRISDYVCQLSSKMHYLPLHQVLNSSVLFEDFDQATINRVLGQLNPFNTIVVLSSSNELENPITEKYLGAKYLIESLPQRNKSGINFQPIPKNRYLPINKTIYLNESPQKGLIPTKIHQNMYFLYDNIFKVCKGGIQLRIYSKQNFQFMEFYTSYLNLLLKELTYPAQTLQCKIQYQPDDCIIITIFGFSDTVLKMLQGISEEIFNVHEGKKSEILFDVALNELIEQYENTFNQESDEVAETVFDLILNQNSKTIEESIEEFKGYKYEKIKKRIKEFWQHNIFKWVAVGNFEEKHITKFLTEVQQKIRGERKNLQVPFNRCLRLTENIVNQTFLESEQLSSSCAIVYYQAGKYSEQLYYKLLLLKNHIDEPFFNELRTLKQMAYYLRVKIENTRGILGLYFILVSSTRDPKNISNEIKSFVESFFGKLNQDLAGENADKLNVLKQSVFTKVYTPHNNLKAFFEFICNEISEKTYFFTRKEESQIKRYLDPITIQDLIQTWTDIRKSTLQLYIVSKAHEAEYQKYVIKSQSIQEIKGKSEFWADLFHCE